MQSWREVVARLAGPDSHLKLIDPTGWDANVVAEVDSTSGLFRGRGNDEDEAWLGVAHSLADYLLWQALEDAPGWSEVDNVIDETTYTVARDPAGALWAIGAAASGAGRRAYIERDMATDGRAFDRTAFIEPIDTLDTASVLAALVR